MAERHDEDSLAESAERVYRQLQMGSATETSKDLPPGVHQVLRLLATSHESVSQSDTPSTDDTVPDGSSGISIDRFQLLRPLGQGGYGVVYLARDTLLKRVVALKLPKPHVLLNSDLRQRFLREARAASNLHHPHIAQVYDASESSDASYIACEYCDGGSLADWLDRNETRLDCDTIARLLAQLADAVDHAHDAGILHRDLKPSNILLQSTPGHRQEGLPYVAKVADFGLAKLQTYDDDTTTSGVIVGSFKYMAPEQAMASARDIDVRTDVYSLGVIMYQLLTGSVPFEADSQLRLLRDVVERSPIQVRQLSPETPRDLAAICMKCLEKRPTRRYQTAALLRDDLNRFLNGQPTVARPVRLPERVFRWSIQNPALSSLAGLVIVFALLGIAGLAFHNRQIQRTVDELELTTTELKRQTMVAEATLELAQDQEKDLRIQNYTLDVAVAYAAWWRMRPRHAAEALERHIPSDDQNDLRCAAWYLLHEQIRPATLEPFRADDPVHGAMLPDGLTFAFTDQTNVVRLVNVDTGEITKTLLAPFSRLREIAVSGDGRFLAVASMTDPAEGAQTGAMVGAFDLDGDEFIKLGEHKTNVEALTFAPGENLLTSGARYQFDNLKMWDLDRREEVLSKAIGSRNESIRYSPCGRWFAYSQHQEEGDRHEVRVVNRATEQVVLQIGLNRKDEFVCFSSDGNWMALSSMYAIDIYEMDGFTLFETLIDIHARTSEITFSPNDEMLIASGRDGTLRFWKFTKPTDADIKRPMRHFVPARSADYHQDRIRSISFDHRGRMITTDDDGAIHIADPRLKQIGPLEKVDRIEQSPDGTIAALFRREGKAWIRSGKTNRVVKFNAGDNTADWDRQLAISRDNQWIAHSWRDTLGVVKADNPDTMVWQKEVPIPVSGMDISPTRSRLVTTHRNDNRLFVWNVADGGSIEEVPFPTSIATPRFSPDGRWLVLADYHGNQMFICHGDQFEVHHRLPLQDELQSARFSPDGHILATGHINGQVGLWDTDTWEIRHWGTDHETRWMETLSFSPDGKTLASGSVDGVRLWHIATGRGLGQLFRMRVRGLAFTPDGESLIVANESEPWIIQVPITRTGTK